MVPLRCRSTDYCARLVEAIDSRGGIRRTSARLDGIDFQACSFNTCSGSENRCMRICVSEIATFADSVDRPLDSSEIGRWLKRVTISDSGSSTEGSFGKNRYLLASSS